MNNKAVYSPPSMSLTQVTTEHTIAAGSVTVNPVQEGNTITDEYDYEEQNFNVGW